MHILLHVVMATLFVWHSVVLMPSEHALSARLLQLRRTQHWWASMGNSCSVYQHSLRYGCTPFWGISMQGLIVVDMPSTKGSISCSIVAGWEYRKIVFFHVPSPVPLLHRVAHWLSQYVNVWGLQDTYYNRTGSIFNLCNLMKVWYLRNREEKDWKLPSKVFPMTLLVLCWDISPASLRKRWTVLLCLMLNARNPWKNSWSIFLCYSWAEEGESKP